MSSRFGLLRLDYTFSVIVPMLIAIYLNSLNIFLHIDIILGFVFFAIAGNTWNDFFDMRDPDEVETLKRVEGYHPKEIFTIGLVCFVLGISLFLRTCLQNPLNAIFLVIIIVMVLLYCKWAKLIPILNLMLLGASHVLLPYFMIKVDAGLPLMTEDEWILMIAFLSFALTGQLVHETIDNVSSLRKHFNIRQCQVMIWIGSLISIVLGVWAFFVLEQYYFFPFIFMPLGTMYTFRRPTESTQGVKDIGILIGNFLLWYFLCLITMQMVGVL